MEDEWDLFVETMGQEIRIDLLLYLFGSGNNFRPYAYGLSVGGDGLLLRMGIIGKLNTTVGFGKREFYIGQGESQAMTRNKKNQWVSPFPTAREYAKLEEYSAKVGTLDLEAMSTRADFGDISEVGGSFSF